MPSNKSLVFIALIALLAWLASMSFFVVNEQQSGIKRRFDRVVEADLAPGLHMKLPVVDKVVLVDKRVQVSTLDSQVLVLSSGEEAMVDVAATWQIDAPERYDRARRGDDSNVAHDVMQAVATQIKAHMSHLTLGDLSTPRQAAALAAARADLSAHVHNTLGVNVTGVSLRLITLPDTRLGEVEKNMTVAWRHEASAIEAEGQDVADQMRVDTERRSAMMLAAAHESAEAAKGATDIEVAARYNDAYSRNPSFFRFYQGLKTWREGMQRSKGVMVVGPQDDLMRWINVGH